ncbi:N-acetylglutaminylglutamine amidotransferase [Oceanibaculum pacificum]|uniref:asparagine synthase (glutamine-hydrolyzing) n=1 Tax=Oceanibaculum pacificum TaxID=580166 RepID=A0A154WGK4_9PROT|nr:N-acetylglutaminylglutamine amidotransferase [Oceanibaculum pacificum]KZD12642.1 asparagine synthetase B [Oceanibaculum pacificum]
MCGIAGEIRFDDRRASSTAVSAMTAALAPRGPDGEGIFLQGRVALGHRRLKIIDLSERAQQPMVDNELGVTIVFNGIIYNYRELMAELEAKGYRFFSTGDTEVVLKAFHAWGPDCVKRFHGMFAFAAVERDSGRVTIARDRLGIKPFYYAETDKSFRFASGLPALIAAAKATGEALDTDIDRTALHHYMSFHAVVPAPYTILKGIRKLPPATVMVIEPDGSRKEERYWAPDFVRRADEANLSFEDWQEKTLDALTLAVKRRLVADVPVGVLLSGGLDSSLVVGLLAKLGQQDLKTFSVGFETVGEERGDEFQYSDIVAEHFGTDHHQLFVDSSRALPELANCIHAMAEPMVSHDAIGFYLLSQEVAKHVKVVQSGQGADEVFAGYHWYPPLMSSNDAVGDYSRVFFDRTHAEFAEAVDPRFVNGNASLDFVTRHMEAAGADTAVDKALRLDTTIMLVDDPVKRVDNMTMAWGLEARVPFLDHELVELAARIPPEMKVEGDGKYVLKEAARKVIPASVIDRPKGYFPVPALKYLRGPFLKMVDDALHSPRARERQLFNPAYIDTLLADPDAHLTPLRGSKLWQCGLLELWLQSHGV